MRTYLPDTTPFDGVPYVGCAATIPCGSDSYPGTVVRVEGETEVRLPIHEQHTRGWTKARIPRKVWIRRCEYEGIEGHSNAFTEDQRYRYFEDDEHTEAGRPYSWRPRWNRYIEVGTPSRSTAAQPLFFGRRRAYRDPCF